LSIYEIRFCKDTFFLLKNKYVKTRKILSFHHFISNMAIEKPFTYLPLYMTPLL